MRLPWTFSTFDYRALCELLFEQTDGPFETAKVDGRSGDVVHTDRGDIRAPLIVDALGWRRMLARDTATSRPTPRSRAGSRCTRTARSDDLEIWIDRGYVPAGYGWSFPADDEQRVGVGSFDPRLHVKDTTVRLAEDLERERGPLPGQLDPAQDPRPPPRTASSSSATRPATACR